MRAILLAAAAICALGPAACRARGEPLTARECEELVRHIKVVIPTSDADDELDECLAGETWNRVGYDCAMKAGFRAALSSCLMKQR